MPTLLQGLEINRVDLVDEGANSAAFIEIYKRKEQSNTMEIKEILEKMNPEHATVIQAELDKLNGVVAKSVDDLKATQDQLKATTDENNKTKEDLKKTEDDLKTANDACAKAQDELKTAKGGGVSFDEAEVLKSMPEGARELFTKMKAQKDAAEETLRKAKEAEANAEAVAKAASLKALPVDQDKLLGILKGASPELLDVLTSVNTAMEEAVLGEVGKGKPGHASVTSDDAWKDIEKKADEVAKASGISKAKAVTQVVNENPDLYKKYLEGGAD